ncbi:MAG: cytochrome P460 family protein [Rhizobacter sp.]|nr:cytochrome P460 family protein [Chlorobiales bacterium]
MKDKSIFFSALLLLTSLLFSCQDSFTTNSPPPPVTVSDADLLALTAAPGFAFYKNAPDTLPFTLNGGGHNNSFIRVRFNAKAQSVLTDGGKLPVGGRFPDSALIVKDIYTAKGGTLLATAIMLRLPAAANADANGWVWGEYNSASASNPPAPASQKGSQCTACHSTTAASSPVSGDTGNRDYVRTFGLRP